MPLTYNGTGTEVYYWYPGHAAKRKLLPINITSITHNGVTRTVMETTHLLSNPPDEANEFGGRTYEPGVLEDPGELSLACFADPNVIPPRGKFLAQIRFPRQLGYQSRARWLGFGFFTTFGGFTVGIDENVTTTMTLKLSGNVSITRAQRNPVIVILPPTGGEL